MEPIVRRFIMAALVLVVVFGAYTAFTTYSTRDVNATLELGTNADGTMFLRCAAATGGAICGGGDQGTLTVSARDRVHLAIVNKDQGDHSHDFNLLGWQYAIWPNSPEQELHAATETASFTAWSTGSFRLVCELSGHDGRGMHGTLVVQ